MRALNQALRRLSSGQRLMAILAVGTTLAVGGALIAGAQENTPQSTANTPQSTTNNSTATNPSSPTGGTTATSGPSDLTERGGGGTQLPGGTSARQSGKNNQGFSPDLLLNAARIESEDLHNNEDEFAVFSFDHFVQKVNDDKGFPVVGHDVEGARVASTSARLVQGDPTMVLAGFPAGTDLRQFTIGFVQADAVQDEAGKTNPATFVALDGSSAGNNLTERPALLSVRPSPSLERAVYTFDQQLDESGQSDASKFGFYTADGHAVPASSIITVVDNTATVQFDRQVEDAVRFYAKEAGVKSRKGMENMPGSSGGATTAPDLVSVSGPIGTTQFDFVFDAPVTSVDIKKFALHASSGAPIHPEGFTQPSAETLRMAFPKIHDFAAAILMGSVDEGAVKANDGSDAANTVGVVPPNSKSTLKPGLTQGPDLTSAFLDKATDQVTFVFDEPVDDDQPYDAANYYLLTPSGDLILGRAFVEADQDAKTVTITFDKDVVDSAIGVGVMEKAVQDTSGKPGEARTIRI